MRKGIFATISTVLLLAVVFVSSQPAQAASGASGQTKAKAAKATQGSADKTPAKAAEPGSEYPRPPKPAKHYTIGVLLPQLANPHFVGQAYGYTDEAEKLGAKVILYDAGGYQYIEKQVSQMEDLIASKVDAIDLVTLSPTALVAEVEAATNAGIPVFACNTVPNSNKIITKVKSSDAEIGEMQANYMVQALHGKGNVVMMSAAPGVTTFADRGKAFKKRIAETAPGIKILSEQFSQSTPQDGLRLMEDFMQTYSQIDGEYNAADTTAIGAAQVIRSAGKAGKIVITTTDFQPDTEKFMREGVVNAAVVQQTVLIGRWCIRATVNHLEKRPVPAEIRTPVLLVTKSNLDSIDLRGVRPPKGWVPPTR